VELKSLQRQQFLRALAVCLVGLPQHHFRNREVAAVEDNVVWSKSTAPGRVGSGGSSGDIYGKRDLASLISQIAIELATVGDDGIRQCPTVPTAANSSANAERIAQPSGRANMVSECMDDAATTPA
jgi:hypothetical protein